MPIDLKMIIKLLSSMRKDHPNLKDSHELIVSTAVYNRAIEDAIELITAIQEGDISQTELKDLIKED